MKTPQEILDFHWDRFDKTIKELTCDAMQEYADEQNADLKAENEQLKMQQQVLIEELNSIYNSIKPLDNITII